MLCFTLCAIWRKWYINGVFALYRQNRAASTPSLESKNSDNRVYRKITWISPSSSWQVKAAPGTAKFSEAERVRLERFNLGTSPVYIYLSMNFRNRKFLSTRFWFPNHTFLNHTFLNVMFLNIEISGFHIRGRNEKPNTIARMKKIHKWFKWFPYLFFVSVSSWLFR